MKFKVLFHKKNKMFRKYFDDKEKFSEIKKESSKIQTFCNQN